MRWPWQKPEHVETVATVVSQVAVAQLDPGATLIVIYRNGFVRTEDIETLREAMAVRSVAVEMIAVEGDPRELIRFAGISL